LVVTSDGTTRGFVKVINCENPIWYVERSTGDWQHVATPYIGDVLSVATDGSNVYLLFRDYQDEAVHVARRAPNGAFDPEQTLATNTRSSGFRAPVSGALLATNGTWWAVWSQDVGTNRELFQAKTFGTVGVWRQDIGDRLFSGHV
jgi:hypothetical protein